MRRPASTPLSSAPGVRTPIFEGLSVFRKIVLGFDMYQGELMVKGWKRRQCDTEPGLEGRPKVGVAALLCTELAGDGTLTGPDPRAEG